MTWTTMKEKSTGWPMVVQMSHQKLDVKQRSQFREISFLLAGRLGFIGGDLLFVASVYARVKK